MAQAAVGFTSETSGNAILGENVNGGFIPGTTRA
jgi:hypothetical protein